MTNEVREICEQLKYMQWHRRFYTKQINRQVNAGAALIRREMYLAGLLEAGDNETGIKDPKGIAVKTVMAILNDKEPPDDCPKDIVTKLMRQITSMVTGVAPTMMERDATEDNMRKLSQKLPAWLWVKGVRGFGPLGFAAIVGTSGDISNYPNPDKLKKRLGLSVFDGKAYSTWRMKGGLSSDDWTEAHYDPKARSVVFADVEDSMMKGQFLGKAKTESGETEARGPYGALFLAYQSKDKERNPDFSPKYLQMRARRYMAQQLIIDLWCQWHGKPRHGRDTLHAA